VKWLAQSTIYRDSVDLICVEIAFDKEYVGNPIRLDMSERSPNTIIAEPTLALRPDSARSLLQALWDAGIRPADWSSPDGEINALRKHVDFAEHVAKTLLKRPSRRNKTDGTAKSTAPDCTALWTPGSSTSASSTGSFFMVLVTRHQMSLKRLRTTSSL
jgi:hypothetical protein